MEPIITEVFKVMLTACTKEASPVDIIRIGVNELNGKPIAKHFKKEIIKAIIERIAHGRDGVPNTEDDRLSPKTVEMLLMLLETDAIDYVIDGVVSVVKKSGFKTCFKFGWLSVSYKKLG
jgi:hypothetical protein